MILAASALTLPRLRRRLALWPGVQRPEEAPYTALCGTTRCNVYYAPFFSVCGIGATQRVICSVLQFVRNKTLIW